MSHATTCRYCGSDNLEVLGTLGQRIVYRCRACGVTFTWKAS